MKRTIRPLSALIFGAVCTLLAPLSHATRISAQENTRKPAASAVAQGHRKAGKTPDPSEKFDLETMSSMGRLAQLAATGRLRDGQSKAKDNNKLVGRAVVGGQPVFKLQADDDGVDRDNADGPSGGQAQPSIAVDSMGQHIVIGLNDTRGFDLNPIAISGFMYSDDGGKTFTDGGQLPPGPFIDFIGSTAYPQIFGDPEVKYVGGSTFIYVSIMVKKLGTSSTTQTLCFHKSTDFGHTWSGPFEIPAATNPNGLLNGESVDAADKPFADVDPDSGRLLVSWSNFTPFALGGVEISTTFSDNILNSTPTWSPRIVVAATEVDGQSSIPRFAGNGSPNVYLAWRRFSGPEQDNVGFARSTDNGATWSTPVNVAADFFMVDQVLGDDRVNSAPGMAVDNSSGPGKGTLYLVYSNNDLHDGADIVLQRSTDGGVTFSRPFRINSRPGNDRSQWYPWVTVDKSSGRVYVFYYDQGVDTTGDLTEVTYQFSDNYGLTWKYPMPLTDRPFKAGWGNDTGQPNLGDYNQAIAQNGELFAAWAQTRLLPFTNGLPSPRMGTPNVAFKRVPASATRVSLMSNFRAPTFTDSNGNGFIDAGEQIRLRFPLFNYVTNAGLNPTTVTGIVATLSSTTSAVSVVQSTASYPSIDPGASARNDRDFIIQLSPSYVRGTPLELVFTITTNQGSTVLLASLPTGTPRPTTIFQENFDTVAPGTLPDGWLIKHAGGNNTVPWTTSNTFNPGNNGAFHIEANDGAAGNSNRWERLLSPLITVPAESEYVTVDFDVMYDTEDDPDFNILAYDGFLLRVGDYGPDASAPTFIRAVLAEAFEEQFTTDGINHYPKHLPRSNSTAYFQDMSAWAGNSAGVKHVRMKLNGMAGRAIRLWWEYTQDTSLTCRDVRPSSAACGVLIDNVVVQSVVTVQADLSITKSITSGQAVSGGNITYAITATNNGPALDISSTVTDNLPRLLTFVSCSADGGTCSGSGNNQSITLPPGSSAPRTITLVGAISCSAAGGTPLSNTATIASRVPDPDWSNNFSTASTTIFNPLPVPTCPADMVMTALPGETSARANYMVTATDNCPLPAGAVSVTPPSGTAFRIGTTSVSAIVTDSGGDQARCSFNVTVNGPTSVAVARAVGQYSDVVMLTATVSPTAVSDQTPAGTVNFIVNGVAAGSGAINSSGVAVLRYKIVQGQGTYSIDANFVSTSPFFLNSSGSGTLAVAPEDAVVRASSSNPRVVAVSNPDGTASFSLSAAITEAPDGSPGDISKATPVTFNLIPPDASKSPISRVATIAGDGTDGILTATATFTDVPASAYQITIEVGGDFYRGSTQSTVAVNWRPSAADQSMRTRGNTSVTITLNGADRDGDPLTFSIVTPPAHGRLSGSGANVTYTPAPNYIGTDTFTFGVSDGNFPPVAATVDITVYDDTPPVIVPTTSGNLGKNGWYRSDVTITWSITDAESAITSRKGCEPVTVTADTTGTTFTCAAESGGGTATKAVTIKRDATPPFVSMTRTPEANAFGWNNTDVKALFAAVDAVSGIDGSAAAQILFTTEGAKQSARPVFSNAAGNTVVATIDDVNIDKTPPEAFIQFGPILQIVQAAGRDLLSGVLGTPLMQDCTPAIWGDDDDDDDGNNNPGADDRTARLCTITITDRAGNSVKVKLKTDDDDHGHKTKVHIVSIQYNGEILTETPFNTMAFQWTVDKQGGIKELRQSMTTGRGKEKTQVDATFNAKNNQTTIDLHNGKQGKVVKPGLNLLRLATNKGSLNIEY